VILDSIDKFRANEEYMNLRKEMRMNQRILKIESWLQNNWWKTNVVKKIENVHFVVKFEERTVKKEMNLMVSHMVVIPECMEFEKIHNPCGSKIEKAINCLKWKKEKFRLNKIKFTKSNEISDLFGRTGAKYGVQVNLNSFLIWKYTIRRNIYAEITILSGIVVFRQIRSRKKRSRLEILFEIMQNPILKNNFNVNNLYMLNKDNLKFLMHL
jgi:hypothetical protein